ncbi:type 4a pilus biogenesis protein PilO [Bacillus rubiinfantis]|uniref:type 4a pilus biogenesis protein PilO n=1 Tax=Bacillus rubiinfantis TaxID=1499680 RepID=UPI0005A77F6F|nr:hypothetical protein [Bacillus rubiinfantis]
MNLEFSKKHLLIIIVSGFVIGLLVFFAYYQYIIPVNNSLQQKKSELKMTSQELTIIQDKLKQASKQTAVSTMQLQQQVPVKRMLDQLFLNVEKAEIVSGSTITEIKLNSSEEGENQEVPQVSTETAKESSTGSEKPSSEKDQTMPSGIKKTSILVSGEAETYFEMERFVQEVKALQRIIKIEQFTFTGQEERHLVDQTHQPIKFEAVLAAYYYPELVDLQKELPPLDIPAVSNKKDPLSEYTNSAGNDDEP